MDPQSNYFYDTAIFLTQFSPNLPVANFLPPAEPLISHADFQPSSVKDSTCFFFSESGSAHS